jgi:tetratricopeptide (TPR) repeat protein
MAGTGQVSLPSILEETLALPAFPSLPAAGWQAVEERTAWLLEAVEDRAPTPALRESAFAYAGAIHDRGDECGAEEVWEELLRLCAERGEGEMAAFCALRLSRCAMEQGEERAALDWCRRASAFARPSGQRHPVRHALAFQLGLLNLHRGDFPAARKYFLDCLELPEPDAPLLLRWEGIRPEDVRVNCLTGLADIALKQAALGGGEVACRLEEARGWLVLCGSPSAESPSNLLVLANWAELANLSGRREEARRMLEAALADENTPPALRARFRPILLRILATFALSTDNLEEAQRLAREAFNAGTASRSPIWDRLMVRDLVAIFSRDHERRHSGYREERVLQALEGEGSWIRGLVEYVEERDPFTAGSHARNVGALAQALLSSLQDHPDSLLDITEMDRAYLRGAALLHDIGELEISWALLNRLRPLKPRHLSRLQQHVLTGSRMLERLGFPMTARIVEEHHEQAGGGGYPFGTKDQTPAGAVLALSEWIAARAAPTRAVPHPPSLEETVAWCLREGARRFQPCALNALWRASESGALAPLGPLLAGRG